MKRFSLSSGSRGQRERTHSDIYTLVQTAPATADIAQFRDRDYEEDREQCLEEPPHPHRHPARRSYETSEGESRPVVDGTAARRSAFAFRPGSGRPDRGSHRLTRTTDPGPGSSPAAALPRAGFCPKSLGVYGDG